MPGAHAALDRLRRAGIRMAVVTNQSGIARGLLTRAAGRRGERRIEQLLGPFGPWLVCPHGPDDGCACRKPAPGLVLQAARAAGRARPSAARSSATSAPTSQAAHAAGARAILVPTRRTLREEVDAAPGGRTRPARARSISCWGRRLTHVLVARMDSEGDVLLAGPAVRAVAHRRRPGDPAVRPARARGRGAAARRRRGARPSRALDRRRARARRSRRRPARSWQRCRRDRVDQAAILPRSTRARCPWRCCSGWPAWRDRRDQRRLPGLAARRPAPGPTATCTRCSAGLGVVAALGLRLPPGDDGRLAVRRDRALGRAGARTSSCIPGASRARPRAGRRSATPRSSGRSRRPGAGRSSPAARGDGPHAAASAGDRGVDLGGATSMPELAEVLAHADCVVVGNTGPAHLAAAVGTPVVSLFAPTVPAGALAALARPPRAAVRRRALRRLPGAGVPGAGPSLPGRRRRRTTCSAAVPARSRRRGRSPHEDPALARARLVDDVASCRASTRTCCPSCPTAVPTGAVARRPGSGRSPPSR